MLTKIYVDINIKKKSALEYNLYCTNFNRESEYNEKNQKNWSSKFISYNYEHIINLCRDK